MRPAGSKDALRRAIQSRRTGMSEQQWSASDAARTTLLLAALGQEPTTVALYASRPHEPGTREAITQLHAAGWHVVLPVLARTPAWALFRGWERMRLGYGNIPEPHPHTAFIDLAEADVVVIACLAAAADGTRLGTGGGWYDRALPQRRPGVPVWALANSAELTQTLPAEPHDVPVDRVVTELGIHACGGNGVTDISAPWRSELS